MGKQANPERIRQFQADAQLLLNNGWIVAQIAERMDIDPSNLGANFNYRAVDENGEVAGKKPGEAIIKKFYFHFHLEIERLKHDPKHKAQETDSEFNQDERQRRIEELEATKKYLEDQMAAIIQNNTTLTNTNAGLGSDIGDLSRAYVELAMQAQRPASADRKSEEGN